jgi:outer membrane protein TolC
MNQASRRIFLQAVCLAVVILAAPATRAASPVERASKDADQAIDAALLQEPGLPRPVCTPRTYDGSRLTLDDAVRLAFANNTRLVRRREEIRLAALGVAVTRHDYEPQFYGTVSSGFSQNFNSQNSQNRSSMQASLPQSVGVTQKLPLGGSLSIYAGGQGSQFENQPWLYTPTASISVTQPLLRGAGFGYNYEKLFGAKRSLIYNLRAFKLEQEDFEIGIVSEFLSLINLQQQVRNLAEKVAGYDQLYLGAQALYSHNWTAEIDFLRVAQEKLQAENELGESRTQFQTRLETFKLALNIPADAKLELAEFFPDYEKLEIDPDKAVSRALASRVDLKTAREVVEDATRHKGMAKQDMLPDLSLNLSAFTTRSDVLSNLGATTENFSTYFSLSLPFDRTVERYRLFNAAQISILSQRELDCTRQLIAIDVKNQISRIHQCEDAIGIMDVMIKSETKRHELALYGYNKGLVSNREVIDAFNSLIAVSNQRLNLLAQHFVNRLQLQRNLGEFDINQPLLKNTHP